MIKALFPPLHPNEFRTQNTQNAWSEQLIPHLCFRSSSVFSVQCVIIICRFIFYILNLKSNKITNAHTEPAIAYYIHIELLSGEHVQNCTRLDIFFSHVYVVVDVDVVQMYNFHWLQWMHQFVDSPCIAIDVCKAERGRGNERIKREREKRDHTHIILK